MKITSTLLIVALTAGTGQFASGHDDHASSVKKLSNRDKLRVAVQAVCPISGEKLGGHGEPIKVTVGKKKQEIFLCCKACLKQKIAPKHWATIHANFAKAQRICPVMKKELPKKPKWTIVGGQVVYVCCPPCTKKITAEPKIYLQKIDDLYTASLRAKQIRK